ncbi:NAD(P)-dependent oxidoreductase [Lutibacter sp. TH_r2]|uniref:NAD(P)-dependent oxidoreductase n=1 Tax=Lutibacter sp. TH_r2 TaxID=3082083 RepID=UPI0029551973|nr:NAD(P)-dependent oxidoreductase [Lutibacter sp. TH_r2]MDV7185795.1 NAD(P)-dependent oxidoreductase [Lutibacter sp. TH_r2]
MKLGIIKERKNPPDRRVVLSPKKCKEILKEYPQLTIKVESSDIRVYSDESYKKYGIEVVNDVSDCDVLLGVKEVPIENLIPNKSYFFFSHTIKKQSYNRELLKAIIKNNIKLFDHEAIVDKHNMRLVAFGRYAGIVGAYNGLRTYGLKSKLFKMPKAEVLHNQQELIDEMQKVKLPSIKVVLTGCGRVGNGAKEMLEGMEMREVTVNEFLNDTFNEPVFVQIDALDYNVRKDGYVKGYQDFFTHPGAYQSNFMRFAKVADMYIAGHFYGDNAPFIFTREDAKNSEFNIKVVADISCDIDGPVACTIKPSTIADPIYGYSPLEEKEVDFLNEDAIAVMAVDNLPCELPKDASDGFGKSFAEHVIPSYFNKDEEGVLKRAQVTGKGKLKKRFRYLQDYVDGLE